ncbi:class I SAM-dependent DNA methyltransferase [Nocardioides sp. LHG3406-4]|uniref:class I SAM-dependent DNA methyltransferase n=1 Tax=Nocardioides sp. LHG3406-4 TaxID=2804575 RepID=UPI003CF1C607
MPLPHEPVVRDAYDRLADAYTELFADVSAAHPVDRAVVTAFADLVVADGGSRVADLGCGPGHWTAHLHGRGLDAFGVDLSPVFVATARRRHPGVRFDEGTLTALDIEDGSLDGVLAWFSIIHTPPQHVRLVFAEISRVLRPGGRLLIAFQAADDDATQAFDHKVTTAYRWPVGLVSDLLRTAGIVETARLSRQADEGERFPHGSLMARRS